MSQYTVSFFKNLLSSYGHQFKCLQAAIEVRSRSSKEAVKLAQQRFAHLKRIPDWRIYADVIETVELPGRGMRGYADRADGAKIGRPAPASSVAERCLNCKGGRDSARGLAPAGDRRLPEWTPGSAINSRPPANLHHCVLRAPRRSGIRRPWHEPPHWVAANQTVWAA
jgi:hypothetical protein